MSEQRFERLFYRVSELPEVLGIGKTKCYELIASGELPSIAIAGGRTRRVHVDDVRAFGEKMKAAASGALSAATA